MLPTEILQVCWPFLRRDFLKVAESFSNSGFLDWRLNTTFICLIPKEKGEKSVTDYRSIALLSGVYKLSSKLLANHLKTVMDTLVLDFKG